MLDVSTAATSLLNHPLALSLSNLVAEPASRTFIFYWFSALLIATLWATLAWEKRSQYLKQLIKKKYWWNASSIQDYQLLLLNQLLFWLLSISWLIVTIKFANLTFDFLAMFSEPGALNDTASSALFLIFTAVFILIEDGSRYALHRLLHWRWFWRIHRVHHSATHMTPFTFLRVHPLEKLLYQARSAVTYGLSTGCFFFLVQQHPQQWLIFGVLGGTFLFNLLGANLRHSMIPISYGRLEKLFISPLQHQLHHGIHTSRKNYGSILAIWDRMFGSWLAGNKPSQLPKKLPTLSQQLMLKE